MPHATAATSRAGHRPRWWTELPLIAVVYGLYSLGRLLVHEDIPAAVEHGLAILRLEQALHLNAEHPLNRLLTEHATLGVPADFAYASLHYVVTPAVLVWVFRRRSAVYRAARTWLMTSTLLGLVGFTLMPTCPPRLLDARHGFVDTMAQYSQYGWWGTGASAPRGLSGMTNQYAAMPSLHVGWALWCGVLLWRHGRHPLVRAVGVAYPLLTVLVVMGTANHYFLDAVAGAVVMGLGALLARPVMRIADRIKDRVGALLPRLPASVPPTGSTIVSGGWKTSTGERIPGQRTASADPGAADGPPAADSATAGDDAPAAAR
ncbi:MULTISPECIES: phosphatase PAP2 family protein [unclassified Streptomyces]|uniref:phosphatase PAP2 family protein n=1 Tax=unclassified Streptomyces TaxID=2593676 RepID=UPI00081B7DAD|nr:MULTISPECIES: phosphatase PAP2 family protein [unclassified Streptomyces]MYQ52613.1 PAP2 family protein [Streptomyces sp. SID4941]SCD86586.1 PAP2 superfamily protein [Streptomyces sp. PalvLS-984]SDD08563.1 PAP2 superfamily protein [Streptomyces sp. AmelKG-A3]